MESSIVRQVMEESPEIPNKVAAMAEKFASHPISMNGRDAIKEARHLCGLDP